MAAVRRGNRPDIGPTFLSLDAARRHQSSMRTGTVTIDASVLAPSDLIEGRR
jgi:hypothetical protein